jgi:opine dehydrogenase
MAGIDIIDIASLPYVCRADNQGSVAILGVKKLLGIASIPADNIKKHLQRLACCFPCELIAYPDVLSLNMNITSGMTHPVVTLFNAGRIGANKVSFHFYRDGITPEIAAVIEQIDMERMSVGKALKIRMHSYLELMEQYYGLKYASVYHFFRESSIHNTLPMSPSSLQHRYITQDIASLLVPWYSLGKVVKIECKALGNVINSASMLNNTNYLNSGNNLVHLNLHDKTYQEIKHYIQSGEFQHGVFNIAEPGAIDFDATLLAGGII